MFWTDRRMTKYFWRGCPKDVSRVSCLLETNKQSADSTLMTDSPKIRELHSRRRQNVTFSTSCRRALLFCCCMSTIRAHTQTFHIKVSRKDKTLLAVLPVRVLVISLNKNTHTQTNTHKYTRAHTIQYILKLQLQFLSRPRELASNDGVRCKSVQWSATYVTRTLTWLDHWKRVSYPFPKRNGQWDRFVCSMVHEFLTKCLIINPGYIIRKMKPYIHINMLNCHSDLALKGLLRYGHAGKLKLGPAREWRRSMVKFLLGTLTN